MLKNIFNARGIVVTALLIPCLQSLVIWAGTVARKPNALSVISLTYALQLLAGVIVYSVCCRCMWNCARRIRLNWTLVSVSLIAWITGVALSAWGDLVSHVTNSITFSSDFAFFLVGIPMLLAISLPDEDQRLWWMALIDGIQALLAGCLVYIRLFSRLPFFGSSLPASETLLLRTYNGENLLLAVAATIRMLCSTRRSEERFLYRNLTIYLWVYAAFTAAYNSMDIRCLTMVGYHDVLMELPPLLFAVLLLEQRKSHQTETRPHSRTRLTLFIDTISPLFFTLALMVLSASILRQHFLYGMTAIEITIVLYAVRAALLQNRYMHSQWELAEARDRLEKLSFQDALTGIANRRHFDEILEMEWSRAGRVRQPLSLIMLDVDYFKKLNDRYGHPAGDDCLIRVAHALKKSLPRNGDMVARYGGEEFAVILPTTDRAGAGLVAARMQDAVRALKIRNDPAFSPQVTISVGVATCFAFASRQTQSLVEAADRALYQAKENGRNRIEFCDLVPETAATGFEPQPVREAMSTAGTGLPAPVPGHES